MKKRFLKRIAGFMVIVFMFGVISMTDMIKVHAVPINVANYSELMSAIATLKATGGEITATASITLASSANLFANAPITITVNSGYAIYLGEGSTIGSNIKIIGNGINGGYPFNSGLVIASYINDFTIINATIENTSDNLAALTLSESNGSIEQKSQIKGKGRVIHISGNSKTLEITGGTMTATGNSGVAYVMEGNSNEINFGGWSTTSCTGNGGLIAYIAAGLMDITSGGFTAYYGFQLAGSSSDLILSGYAGTSFTESLYSPVGSCVIIKGSNMPVNYMFGSSKLGSVYDFRSDVYTVTPSTAKEDDRYNDPTTVTIAMDAGEALDAAGAHIHYTLDGSTPTTTNTATCLDYSSAISLPTALNKLKLIASKDGYVSSVIDFGEYHCVGSTSVSTAAGLMTAISNMNDNGGKITVTASITLASSSTLAAKKLIKISVNSGYAIFLGEGAVLGSNIKIIGNGVNGGYPFNSGLVIASYVTAFTVNNAIIESTSDTLAALTLSESNGTISGSSQIIGKARVIHISGNNKTLNITSGTISTVTNGGIDFLLESSTVTINVSGRKTSVSSTGTGGMIAYIASGLVNITGGTFTAYYGFALMSNGSRAYINGPFTDVNVTESLYSVAGSAASITSTDMPVNFMYGSSKNGWVFNLRQEIFDVTPSTSPVNGKYTNGTTITLSIDAGLAKDAYNAAIYYTLDGSDPTTTTSSTCFLYSSAFTLPLGKSTIKAIAYHSYLQSQVCDLGNYENSTLGANDLLISSSSLQMAKLDELKSYQDKDASDYRILSTSSINTDNDYQKLFGTANTTNFTFTTNGTSANDTMKVRLLAEVISGSTTGIQLFAPYVSDVLTMEPGWHDILKSGWGYSLGETWGDFKAENVNIPIYAISNNLDNYVIRLSLVEVYADGTTKTVLKTKKLSITKAMNTFDVDDYGALPDGVTDSTAAVTAAATAAKNTQAPSVITFSSGQYSIGKNVTAANKSYDTDYALILTDMDDVTLLGEGVGTQLLINNPSCGGIKIDGCTNALVKGLSIDYKVLPYTQGTVTAISTQNNTVDVELDEGYADFSNECFNPALFDGSYGMVVQGTTANKDAMVFGPAVLWGLSFTHVSGRTWRITSGNGTHVSDAGLGLSVGDRWVHQAGRWTAFGILGENSTHVAIDDITFYSACSLTTGWIMCDGVKINDMAIDIKPSTNRLLATNSDGVHLSTCRGGLIMENCNFFGNSDNYLDAHSRSALVTEVMSTTKVRVNTSGTTYAKVGDEIQIYDHVNDVLRATVGISAVTTLSIYEQEITFDEPVANIVASNYSNYLACDNIYYVTACGQGSVVRYNDFGVHRGYDTLISSHDFLVASNTIKQQFGPSVQICHDPQYSGGIIAYNITIRDNTFTGTGVSTGQNAMINMYAPIKEINNITIQDNTFTDIKIAAIAAVGVDGLTITNNTISTSTAKCVGSSILDFANSEGIVINTLSVTEPNSNTTTPSIIKINSTVTAGTAGYTASGVTTTLTYEPSNQRPAITTDLR
ncbi:MAG: FN3 associated domain-containing protein [Saccharofermentanales bacterium]